MGRIALVVALVVGSTVLVAGCRPDRCRGAAPAFELAVTLAAEVDLSQIVSLWVNVTAAGRHTQQVLDVQGKIGDRRTTVAVIVGAVGAGGFVADVSVEARDGNGWALAQGQQSLHGSGDACNFFDLTLGANPKDGGLDARRDGGPDRSPDAFLLPGEWVPIPSTLPSPFLMGSPTNEPCRSNGAETEHSVTLKRAFTIGATEVTRAQFRAVMGYDNSDPTTPVGNGPVNGVTWHEAAAYCTALAQRAKLQTCYICSGAKQQVVCTASALGANLYACTGYRLPTDAEWEYAYRSGTSSAFYKPTPTFDSTMCLDGNLDVEVMAWFVKNAGGVAQPAKSMTPNAWGLYDMAGNVSEWTHDGFVMDLGGAAVTDPVNDPIGASSQRVLRNGSFKFGAAKNRAAYRDPENATSSYSHVGFRCARSL